MVNGAGRSAGAFRGYTASNEIAFEKEKSLFAKIRWEFRHKPMIKSMT
jgi:hypothetical protein